MKIRTQFIITTIAFGVIVLAISATLFLVNQHLQQITRQQEITSRLQQESNELAYLSNDYLIFQEDQQLTRWDAKFASLSNDLASLRPSSAEQQTVVNNMQTNLQQLKSVFSDVRTAAGNASQSQTANLDPAFIRTAWSRLEIQDQGLIFNSTRLSQLLHAQENQLKFNFDLLIFVLVGLFGVFVIGNYFLNYRRTINSIAALQAGTKIIGSGNLDYNLPANSKDEIGDLSRAFNRMTSDLKTVTASKADLEREIEERKKFEEALTESEQRYRSLFENMIDGYAYCRMIFENNEPRDFVYIAVNKSFERLTGLKDVTGKKVSEVIPGIRETNPESFQIYGRVALTGEPARFETYVDQLKIWLLISVYSPERGTFTAVFENITERKKAEEAVRERTTELEATNKELEAFNYSVSHDLRQPLRALDGFSLAVINDYRDKLDDKGKDYLNRVRKASQTMGLLIDDLLKLSRVTRVTMDYNEINLSVLVDAIAEELKTSQPERRVEFVIAPGMKVNGDQPLLIIALKNLLENAWKFSRKTPEARIEVGVVQQAEANVYFIKDNGVGFDMKYANKLFRPFQRLHSGQDYEGTGIGLATVQRIIQRHGGRIWVESEPGKGAAVYFTLGGKDSCEL